MSQLKTASSKKVTKKNSSMSQAIKVAKVDIVDEWKDDKKLRKLVYMLM